MRKWQQEKILQIMDSLQKIHKVIRKYLEGKNFKETLKLLTECQESAICVGNIIEEIEGNDCVTVKYLEEYCELLYSISQKMFETIDGETAFLLLFKLGSEIEESIHKDIVIRKEVVFFPYKASMWDSLESIYLAAKADPNCDAYCVPIPYFDKNPDGSFSKFHFEGSEYSSDIEITDWEKYSFEENCPDVIYIHNPYDEYNFVTSVHPRFYASNLCKYTARLVYVPYFILPEIESTEQDKIDDIKHFCYVPGTIYAHKVILQSENIKQIYLNEYIRVMREQGKIINMKTIEEKFLGIGSPKFDQVRVINKNNMNLPMEWKKLIFKKNGKRKKIILYNISITGLLQYNEKMIQKMKYVFTYFKNNCENVVLWWRPHPLIKATISSMRPFLWDQYEKVLDNYRKEEWGIYDDTTDLHRAINISDAYYGDVSSLIQIYQNMGKPIMLHNVESNDLLL